MVLNSIVSELNNLNATREKAILLPAHLISKSNGAQHRVICDELTGWTAS